MRCVIVTFLLAFMTPVFGSDYGHWTEFVPKSGTAKAQVMVLGVPKDIQEISEKLELARQADPEFFVLQRDKAKPDEPMEYDERLGISEAEYTRLLAGAQEVVMHPSGEVDIEFSIDELGLAVLTGLPIDPPHDKLKYDMEQDTMYTPYGDLNTLARVAQDNADAPTGAWTGLQWSMTLQENESNFAFVSFAIGKLRDKPKNLIYYQVSVALKEQSQQYHYVLIYDATE